jgi:hypothetical protein
LILILKCDELSVTNRLKSELPLIHMTSMRSKFYITLLIFTFQLLVIPQILSHLAHAHPTTTKLLSDNINTTSNIPSSNLVNMMKNQTDDILVLFARNVNVSTIYDSFNEFKMLFGIEESTQERKVIFQPNKGKRFVFISVALRLSNHISFMI